MADAIPPAPPAPRRPDTDLYHGVLVPDPYRWLEDGTAPATREWVALHNERTHQALDARSDRGQWHERLVALTSLPVVLQAKACGRRLFVLERASGAEQYALVVRSSIDPAATSTILFDPATAASDAATAVDWFFPSPDGALVAIGTSDGGTENSTLAMLDVATGTALADVVTETRAATVAWLPDASGFYYTSYPAGDQYNRRVMLHTLGTDAATDTVVWSDPERPQSWPDVQMSSNGRFLLVETMVGWGHIEAFLLDRATDTWTTVVAGIEAISNFAFAGDLLVGTTTVDAPRGRVVAASVADPGCSSWRTIAPESAGVAVRAVPCGDEVLVIVTDHAVDRIERWTLDGVCHGEVADLGLVSVMGLVADESSSAAFVTITGFDAPATLHRYHQGEAMQPWHAGEQARGVPALAVTRVQYPSKDGTPIGLFLIHRRDVTPGPHTPTILNGYGGFAITETPVWSPTIAAWCERGGLYAIAGLRGGLEEGEAWHVAGRRAAGGGRTSRTCSTTSTPRPTGWWTRAAPAERCWRSPVARTAGCWWGWRSPSVPISAPRCGVRSRCST